MFGEGFIPFPYFSWKWFLAYFEADSKGQSLAALSDDQCLKKAAKGDERAFSELFNRHGDLVAHGDRGPRGGADVLNGKDDRARRGSAPDQECRGEQMDDEASHG